MGELATDRLQLGADLPFERVSELLPYFAIQASAIFTSRPVLRRLPAAVTDTTS